MCLTRCLRAARCEGGQQRRGRLGLALPAKSWLSETVPGPLEV